MTRCSARCLTAFWCLLPRTRCAEDSGHFGGPVPFCHLPLSSDADKDSQLQLEPQREPTLYFSAKMLRAKKTYAGQQQDRAYATLRKVKSRSRLGSTECLSRTES